jgi:hypothetical protein
VTLKSSRRKSLRIRRKKRTEKKVKTVCPKRCLRRIKIKTVPIKEKSPKN